MTPRRSGVSVRAGIDRTSGPGANGPLRVLFVSHSFPPPGSPLENVGGMQRVATELLQALEGHPEVSIQKQLLQTTWKMTHVRVAPFIAGLIYQIPRLVRQHDIEVVLFSSMVTSTLALPLRRRLSEMGVKMAAIGHGRDITLPVAPYQFFLRRILASLDMVLPVSRATATECRKRGMPRAKLRIIPNGVNVDRFTPLEDKQSMRLELLRKFSDHSYYVPPDGLILCGAGRHVERKGFGWFVEHVMPLLDERVHFWLAGEGPLSDEIRYLSGRAGLQHRVRLLGRISDLELESLYRGADLFVMPNVPIAGDLEGFGVVMLEAGMNGLPTVASRLEGIQDVINPGENGYLVQSLNPIAFIDAIQKYQYDRNRLTEDSARAAEFTQRTFTWPSVAGKYIEVLTQLARPEAEMDVPADPVHEQELIAA